MQLFQFNRSILALIIAIFSFSLLVGYGAVATTTKESNPTTVRTFNIGDVLNDLSEKADSEARLEALIAKIQDGLTERRSTVNALQEQLNLSTGKEREQLSDMLEQETLAAMSYQKFAEIQVDNERSLMLRDLYNKIRSSVAVIAELNSYDIVLISDVAREVLFNSQSQLSREAQVLDHIGFQRAVYVSSHIDITEQIVTHMNLEWEKYTN